MDQRANNSGLAAFLSKYRGTARGLGKIAIALMVAEGVGLIGTFLVYNRLNHSQDFRYWMHQKFPTFLEGFYKIGEKMDRKYDARNFDLKTWGEKINDQQTTAAVPN